MGFDGLCDTDAQSPEFLGPERGNDRFDAMMACGTATKGELVFTDGNINVVMHEQKPIGRDAVLFEQFLNDRPRDVHVCAEGFYEFGGGERLFLQKAYKECACVVIGFGIFGSRIAKRNDNGEVGERGMFFHKNVEGGLFDIAYVYTKMKLTN